MQYLGGTTVTFPVWLQLSNAGGSGSAVSLVPSVSQDVVVTVCRDGSIRLNQEPVTLPGLRDRLMRVFSSSPSRVLFVRGELGSVALVVCDLLGLSRHFALPMRRAR